MTELTRARGVTMKSAVTAQTDRSVRAIAGLERAAMQDRTAADRLSDALTHVAGSAAFVAGHVVGFTVWIAVNVGAVPGVTPFDPFPFSFLTLVVSLEAIFLAIFVLMSQNRWRASPTSAPTSISRSTSWPSARTH